MDSRREFLQKTLIFSPFVVWPDSVVCFFQDDLPNVLILGDSISIGYTPFVQEYLKGEQTYFDRCRKMENLKTIDLNHTASK